MRSFRIVFFLLTTATAIRLTSQKTIANDASTNIAAEVMPGRKFIPSFHGEELAEDKPLGKGNNRKVLNRATKASNNGGSAEEEFEDGEEGEGLIYNVDYHGVTTHPPKPKHPNPYP